MNDTVMIPTAIDLERKILGVILTLPDTYVQVANLCHKNLFCDEDNRDVFEAINKCFEDNNCLIKKEIENNLKNVPKGILLYLESEANEISHLVDNIRILKQFYVRRLIINTSDWCIKKAENLQNDEFELADKFRTCYEKISNELYLDEEITTAMQIKNTIELIEEVSKNKSEITGVPSGYNKLDILTGGFQKGELIILAGRPGMGKSTLALEILQNAYNKDYKGAFFSLEMKYQNLWQKMFASACGIDHSKIRKGLINDEEKTKINEHIKTLIDKTIFIYDKGRLGVNEFRVIARNLKIGKDIDFIIVDYLQLMNAFDGSQKPNNREQEISLISTTLKQTAMDLNVPVIALAQLNREVEKRADKRPILSDLRESGSIEQDADVACFLYRDEVYAKESELPKGYTELRILKQRNDKIGKAELTFKPEYSKFIEYSEF